jgi:acylphosphatase
MSRATNYNTNEDLFNIKSMAAKETKRAKIAATGIVQGVNYRWSTKRKAGELGLAGTVRNLPDGSVEVVAEGDEAQIRKLIEWCRQGPRGAVVEKIEVQWHDESGDFMDFSIIYE